MQRCGAPTKVQMSDLYNSEPAKVYKEKIKVLSEVRSDRFS